MFCDKFRQSIASDPPCVWSQARRKPCGRSGSRCCTALTQSVSPALCCGGGVYCLNSVPKCACHCWWHSMHCSAGYTSKLVTSLLSNSWGSRVEKGEVEGRGSGQE